MAASAVTRVRNSAKMLGYKVFGHLPPRLRRAVVGVVAPSFTVGALAILHDGPNILFVRQLHRPGLALPGGLLGKGEPARAALVRELKEEIGLELPDLALTPDTAHVDHHKHRLDLIWFHPVNAQDVVITPGREILSYEWREIDNAELTPQTGEILAGIGARIPR